MKSTTAGEREIGPILLILTCTGLSLAILDGHLGFVPDHLKLFLGIILGVVTIFAAVWGQESWHVSLLKWVLSVIALLTALGCLFTQEPSTFLLSPSLFLLSALLIKTDDSIPVEWSICVGANLYGFGAMYMDFFPALWTTVDQAIFIITKNISQLSGVDLGFGISALPLGTVAFILIILLSESSTCPFAYWCRLVFWILSLMVIVLLGQVLFMATLAAFIQLTVPLAWGFNAVASATGTIIMLLVTGFYLMRFGSGQLNAPVQILAISSLAIGLTILSVSTYTSPEVKQRTGDILFLTPTPELDPLGEYQSIPSKRVALHDVGLFGEFPKQLRLLGFSVSTLSIMPTPDELDRFGLICLVVPGATSIGGLKDLHNLQKFVRQGGSLLVIAEHTNLRMNATVLNDLLDPFGVKINFDTTNAGFGEDLRGIRLWPSDYLPIFNNILAFPYNRGASLTLSYPAKPIMVGRWWQSDYGNWLANDRAFLGDFLVGNDDKLGDLILAAEWKGSEGGRVLVFGDTTPFLNTALGYTLPALEHMVNILMTPAKGPNWLWGFVAGFCLIGVLIGFRWWYPALTRPISMMIVGFLILLLGTLNNKNTFSAAKPSSTLLILADFQNKLDLNIYGNWAPTALMVEACRYDLIPMVVNFDQVKNMQRPAIFLLLAPRRLLSPSEKYFMQEWVKKGSTMVLTLSGEALPAKKNSKEFGLEIGENPLGPISVPLANGDKVKFHSAWPLSFEANWISSVEYQGIPIIAKSIMGLGQIVVIGDEGFAANLDLSTERAVFPSNLRWWGQLFKERHAKAKPMG